MTFVQQFAINNCKYPHTIEILDRWKKEGVNISERICRLIEEKYAESQTVEKRSINQNG
jgi:hypothetical protein